MKPAWNRTHNLSEHPLYEIWQGMKKRCYRKSYQHYKHYGGKGIIVCVEWKNNFQSFYDWSISNGWKPGLTIDRYPNKNGDYEPLNCRWATMLQQASNKNNNRLITAFGRTETMSEFSRITGLNITTIFGRIKAGWSEEDAITKPKFFKNK